MHTLLLQFHAGFGQHQQQIRWTGAGGIGKTAHCLGNVSQETNQQILPDALHTQGALVLRLDIERPIGAQKDEQIL